MIVVTGGFGFIGSNLVHALNRRGCTNILVADDLGDGHKFRNLRDATIADYEDWPGLVARLEALAAAGNPIETVYHLGACSDTVEWDGRKMMDMNYRSSRELLDFCNRHRVPFIYASSAAVYGTSAHCLEDPACERPLNVYGYSKLAFDQHVRSRFASLQTRVLGLRYFNVYGPRESHKGRMASVVYHFSRQLAEGEEIRLFGASHGVAAGEQSRDFIHVDDIVRQTLWAGTECTVSGIFNAGTGNPTTFNALAGAVLDWHGRGKIVYVPFPEDLRKAYQHRTCADLAKLSAAGYRANPLTIEEGVREYLEWLHAEVK